MIRITKEFKFEMAHALHGYDGLCKNIHGHSYRLWVTVEGAVKNSPGNKKDGMLIIAGSLNKLNKKGSTEFRLSGPPKLNNITAFFI